MSVKRKEWRRGDGSIAIVGHKDGGFGWRLLDETGVHVQVRPGRFLDLDFSSPENRDAYEASLKLIDLELKKEAGARVRLANPVATSPGVKRLAGQKRRRLALDLK